MGIISTIFAGFLAGMIAKWIMPGKQGGGFIMTTVLGIAGALVGNLVTNGGLVGNFSLKGLLFSVLGAIAVLFVYGFVTKKK